ncbi:hypothetical protein [Methylobacter sp. sgz302048]|uniref:hypothetical protein n=1 Tax=Methylobacter sp. sgz302048 TaxID=3455945 RepID=UPI003F9EBFAA
MAIFFSKTTNGFYDDSLSRCVLPPDALEITSERHWELLDAQTLGYRIVGDDNGLPTLIAPDLTPAPLSCTAYQIRQALTQLGLREQVETAVANSTDTALKDAWNYAQNFIRNHPKVIEMGNLIGQTPEQLDALFELAVTLAL